ncbi:MAG: 4Fe-4S binding protein [Selenomonas sp.]|nr:4Fe-4S binding protein [Selenomonas sp.]
MAKRSIELARCLYQYTMTHCERCEKICPQGAIAGHTIDTAKCDDCGLCTAVCPTGAIEACVNYEDGLEQVMQEERQLLVCDKCRTSPFPCLGFLNRRLLWTLAQAGDVYLALGACAGCKPAVCEWLQAEAAAANEALQQAAETGEVSTDGPAQQTAGRHPATVHRIHFVRLQGDKQTVERPLLERGVSRRGIFSALFHAAQDKVVEVEQRNAAALGLTFDGAAWLARYHEGIPTEKIPRSLFPGLSVGRRCNACGLCASVCPEDALYCNWATKEMRFRPLACTSCGLCTANCSQDALELLPTFDGQVEFHPGRPEDAPARELADMDATDMDEERE